MYRFDLILLVPVPVSCTCIVSPPLCVLLPPNKISCDDNLKTHFSISRSPLSFSILIIVLYMFYQFLKKTAPCSLYCLALYSRLSPPLQQEIVFLWFGFDAENMCCARRPVQSHAFLNATNELNLYTHWVYKYILYVSICLKCDFSHLFIWFPPFRHIQ